MQPTQQQMQDAYHKQQQLQLQQQHQQQQRYNQQQQQHQQQSQQQRAYSQQPSSGGAPGGYHSNSNPSSTTSAHIPSQPPSSSSSSSAPPTGSSRPSVQTMYLAFFAYCRGQIFSTKMTPDAVDTPAYAAAANLLQSVDAIAKRVKAAAPNVPIEKDPQVIALMNQLQSYKEGFKTSGQMPQSQPQQPPQQQRQNSQYGAAANPQQPSLQSTPHQPQQQPQQRLSAVPPQNSPHAPQSQQQQQQQQQLLQQRQQQMLQQQQQQQLQLNRSASQHSTPSPQQLPRQLSSENLNHSSSYSAQPNNPTNTMPPNQPQLTSRPSQPQPTAAVLAMDSRMSGPRTHAPPAQPQLTTQHSSSSTANAPTPTFSRAGSTVTNDRGNNLSDTIRASTSHLNRLTPAQLQNVSQRMKILATWIDSPDCVPFVPPVEPPPSTTGVNPSLQSQSSVSNSSPAMKAFTEDSQQCQAQWLFSTVPSGKYFSVKLKLDPAGEMKKQVLFDFQVHLQVPPTYPFDSIVWEIVTTPHPGAPALEVPKPIIDGITNMTKGLLQQHQGQAAATSGSSEAKPVRVPVLLSLVVQAARNLGQTIKQRQAQPQQSAQR